MTETEIRDALGTVVDPELGVNIVDLGLVYDISIDDGQVRIVMTMTSPMCPLVDYMKDAVEWAIKTRFPNAAAIEITVVQDPPWHPGLMSPEARRQLGEGREF